MAWILTCLFSSNTMLIVVIMFATEEKRKLWIIFLFLLRHLLKFRAIACHKICKLINYVLQLQICNTFHILEQKLSYCKQIVHELCIQYVEGINSNPVTFKSHTRTVVQ